MAPATTVSGIGSPARIARRRRNPVSIWVGAYKPRMLALTGRKADGWLPSLPYLQEGDLARGNDAIDEAAVAAGRDPRAIRRLLNVPAGLPVEELARFAVEDGVSTLIAMIDDAATLRAFAAETAPALRALVAAARSGRPVEPEPERPRVELPAGEYERLGVAPTPDDGGRVAAVSPWDESTRPHRPPSGPDVTYTSRGRAVGKHLIDVHDVLRTELDELRDVLAQVREGALGAGEARARLNELALRQNDWTLGAFCSRYCGFVASHHGLEDDAIFPHLAQAEPGLAAVLERLEEEHLAIHEAIHEIDRALVHHLTDPDYGRLQAAIDYLTDALRSHLAYEERELVEPLARLGFYPGQVQI